MKRDDAVNKAVGKAVQQAAQKLAEKQKRENEAALDAQKRKEREEERRQKERKKKEQEEEERKRQEAGDRARLQQKIEGINNALNKEMAAVNLTVDNTTMVDRIKGELQRQGNHADLDAAVKDECKRVKVSWLMSNLRPELNAALARAGLANLPLDEVETMVKMVTQQIDGTYERPSPQPEIVQEKADGEQGDEDDQEDEEDAKVALQEVQTDKDSRAWMFGKAYYTLSMVELLSPPINKARALVDVLDAKIARVGRALSTEMARINLSVEEESTHDRIDAQLRQQRYKAKLNATVRKECKQVKIKWLHEQVPGAVRDLLSSSQNQFKLSTDIWTPTSWGSLDPRALPSDEVGDLIKSCDDAVESEFAKSLDTLVGSRVDPYAKSVKTLITKAGGINDALDIEMAAINLAVEKAAMHDRVLSALLRQRFSADLNTTVKDECKRAKVDYLQSSIVVTVDDLVKYDLEPLMQTLGLEAVPRVELNQVPIFAAKMIEEDYRQPLPALGAAVTSQLLKRAKAVELSIVQTRVAADELTRTNSPMEDCEHWCTVLSNELCSRYQKGELEGLRIHGSATLFMSKPYTLHGDIAVIRSSVLVPGIKKRKIKWLREQMIPLVSAGVAQLNGLYGITISEQIVLDEAMSYAETDRYIENAEALVFLPVRVIRLCVSLPGARPVVLPHLTHAHMPHLMCHYTIL